MKKFSMIYFVSKFMLFIMWAKQTTGIFGLWTGSIDKSLVGFKNKQAKVIRKYVVPANPKTPAQTLQRGKFLLCEKIAQKELINLIRPYWNFMSSKYSGFAGFIKANVTRVASNIDFDNILTTIGSYPSVIPNSSSQYNAGTGELIASWDNDVPVNGSAFDRIPILVLVKDQWDPDNGVVILKTYFDNSKLRGDGGTGLTVSLETGLAVSDIYIYIGVSNPATEDKFATGDSIVVQPTLV